MTECDCHGWENEEDELYTLRRAGVEVDLCELVVPAFLREFDGDGDLHVCDGCVGDTNGSDVYFTLETRAGEATLCPDCVPRYMYQQHPA